MWDVMPCSLVAADCNVRDVRFFQRWLWGILCVGCDAVQFGSSRL